MHFWNTILSLLKMVLSQQGANCWTETIIKIAKITNNTFVSQNNVTGYNFDIRLCCETKENNHSKTVIDAHPLKHQYCNYSSERRVKVWHFPVLWVGGSMSSKMKDRGSIALSVGQDFLFIFDTISWNLGQFGVYPCVFCSMCVGRQMWYWASCWPLTPETKDNRWRLLWNC